MSRPAEVLREYERRTLELDMETVRDLTVAAKGRVTIAPTTAPGFFEVAASSYVGSIVVPGLELLIRPKVPLENVFLMLDVGMPAGAWRRESFDYGTSTDLLPAFAAFFARTVEQTIARGLIRSYRAEEERLTTLRGRIDLVEQVRCPGTPSPVACRFDEYTADIAENQLLKAAVRRLLHLVGVRPDTRRLLTRQLSRFEEVSEHTPDPDLVKRMHFTRLNRHYQPALQLAQLVLRRTGLIDRVGGATASSFLLNMNDLFQDFVEDRLQRHLRRHLEVVAEPPEWLGHGRAVLMYPDLVFERAGTPVYVGDTKYKLTADAKARNPDYYQLLAYLTAMNLDEGVLIYCLHDGEAPPRQVDVRHTHKRLFTYALDLSGTISAVEQSVAALAQWLNRQLLDDQAASAA